MLVLLGADLTGHGHPTKSCQNGWDGRALLGQPSKGCPCRISILFPKCSTAVLAPYIKELETYFALSISGLSHSVRRLVRVGYGISSIVGKIMLLDFWPKIISSKNVPKSVFHSGFCKSSSSRIFF